MPCPLQWMFHDAYAIERPKNQAFNKAEYVYWKDAPKAIISA